mmetsp:Transcript_117676/g.344643  ORF Transcript_117676/g.344643 Transcript_117676/m.344643 type:complete len:223 (+) Transcript_117676:536-1204(+)
MERKLAVEMNLHQPVQHLLASRTPSAKAGPLRRAWTQTCPLAPRSPAPLAELLQQHGCWARFVLGRLHQRFRCRRPPLALSLQQQPPPPRLLWPGLRRGPPPCGSAAPPRPRAPRRHCARAWTQRSGRGSRCSTSGTGSAPRGPPGAAPRGRGGSAEPPPRLPVRGVRARRRQRCAQGTPGVAPVPPWNTAAACPQLPPSRKPRRARRAPGAWRGPRPRRAV